MKRTCLAAAMIAATALPATASSDAAWEEFRARMKSECQTLAEAELNDVSVRVDPFGSESYGMALVTGHQGETPVQRICVMDKQSRKVELGGELAEANPAEAGLSFLAADDLASFTTSAPSARALLRRPFISPVLENHPSPERP